MTEQIFPRPGFIISSNKPNKLETHITKIDRAGKATSVSSRFNFAKVFNSKKAAITAFSRMYRYDRALANNFAIYNADILQN